jgi:hypothetical protein
LRFRHDFNEQSSEAQRHIIVHELLHCHLQPMHELARVGLCNEMLQSAYNIFMHGFDQQWEYTIDGIARAWAPAFQIPTNSKKRAR